MRGVCDRHSMPGVYDDDAGYFIHDGREPRVQCDSTFVEGDAQPERRVQCTVTIELAQDSDACDAAVLLGHVREALAAHPNTANWYSGKLVGLVAEVPNNADSVTRWAFRAGADSTIKP